MIQIDQDVLRKGYQSFFLKTETGKYFIDKLDEMINSEHEKAENSPELARDHVQRAKGIRETKAHILSVVSERGQPKT